MLCITEVNEQRNIFCLFLDIKVNFFEFDLYLSKYDG